MTLTVNLGISANKREEWWQGYSVATSDDHAVSLFLKRFGRQPHEVRRNGGALLLGPLTLADLEAKKNGG